MKSFLILLLAMVAPAGVSSAQSLNILCENDPPSEILNPDGSLGGFAVDLVREIQKRVQNRDPIQMVPWSRGYRLIQENPNTMLFSMTRTSERDGLFQWIGPILETTYGFYVRKDSRIAIDSLEDAKTLTRIGVYLKDVRDLYLTGAGFTNLERATDNQALVKMLMADRLDAFAGSPLGIGETLKAAGFNPGDVRLAFVFLRTQSYVATSLEMPPGVVNAWNSALRGMKVDGTLKAILSRYYPTASLPGPEVKPSH